MGHKHLVRLPATKKWNGLVELLVEGAELESIAAAAAEAAESSLPRASKDPALVQTFWLLTQIPLAARTQDFSGNLRKLGVETGPSPGLIEVVGALTEAIDRHVARTGGRTDLGEMAQLAAAESLSSVVGRDLPRLFGTTPDDVKLAVGRFSGKGRGHPHPRGRPEQDRRQGQHYRLPDHQLSAEERVWAGQSSLALMPTGMGKSLLFQLPVFASDGIGVIISPLIALMQQQTEILRELGAQVLALGGRDALDAQEALRRFPWTRGPGFLFVSLPAC